MPTIWTAAMNQSASGEKGSLIPDHHRSLSSVDG